MFLTDDDASDCPSFLNVPSLLCKHALASLQQSDAAFHNLTVTQLRAAVIRLRYGYEPTHLREREIENRIHNVARLKKLYPLAKTNQEQHRNSPNKVRKYTIKGHS